MFWHCAVIPVVAMQSSHAVSNCIQTNHVGDFLMLTASCLPKEIMPPEEAKDTKPEEWPAAQLSRNVLLELEVLLDHKDRAPGLTSWSQRLGSRESCGARIRIQLHHHHHSHLLGRSNTEEWKASCSDYRQFGFKADPVPVFVQASKHQERTTILVELRKQHVSPEERENWGLSAAFSKYVSTITASDDNPAFVNYKIVAKEGYLCPI